MVKKIHTYEMLLAWQMVLCMPARKVVLVDKYIITLDVKDDVIPYIVAVV